MSTKTEVVVTSILSHWQDERLVLALTSDPKRYRWTLDILDPNQGQRLCRRMGLDQALNAMSRRSPPGGRIGADNPRGWRPA
ncbi:MAG: hypothetical protein ACUVQI_06700 [Thermochromatium sp.]